MTGAHESQSESFVYLYGGAIGETIFGIHLARTLAANVPGARLVFLVTRNNPMAQALVAPLPFASYVECSKNRFASWVYLLRLALQPHKIVVHQPLTGPMPLWWRLLLRAATFRRGSVEIRCAPTTTAALVPSRARAVTYNPARDQIFDTIPRILNAWGVTTTVQPSMHLDPTLYTSSPTKKDEIIFHFFAPSDKRSIPLSKAREILRAAEHAFPIPLTLTTDKAHAMLAREMAAEASAEVLEDLLLPDLVRTIAGAGVYVGVDTGITHLACALGTSTVVLGNWSNPCWLPTYAPRAEILVERAHCICNGDKTGECFYEVDGSRRYRCMMDIQIPTITEAIRRALKRNTHE